MKLSLLVLPTLLATSLFTSASQAEALADLHGAIGDSKWVGDMGPNYKCTVETEWTEDYALTVRTTLKYKNQRARRTVMTFSDEFDQVEADTYVQNDGYKEMRISKSKVIREEGEYKVHHIESITFDFEKSKLVTISTNIMEADFESDPHEDPVHCSNLVRVKSDLNAR